MWWFITSYDASRKQYREQSFKGTTRSQNEQRFKRNKVEEKRSQTHYNAEANRKFDPSVHERNKRHGFSQIRKQRIRVHTA